MCGSGFATEFFATTRSINWLFQCNFMEATKNYRFESSRLFRQECHKLSDYIVKTILFLQLHDRICVFVISQNIPHENNISHAIGVYYNNFICPFFLTPNGIQSHIKLL